MTYFWVSGNNQEPTQTTRVHLILAALYFMHASFCVLHLWEKTINFFLSQRQILLVLNQPLVRYNHSETIPLKFFKPVIVISILLQKLIVSPFQWIYSCWSLKKRSKQPMLEVAWAAVFCVFPLPPGF